MRRWIGVASLALLCGCMSAPPAPPAPRVATQVRAPFAKTWNAVIDVFAERNIPIKNMERASGFISTDELAVPVIQGHADSLADCGRVIGMPLPPDRATYNVLVRGDSTSSTAKVTVRWTQGGTPSDPKLIECTTRGVWEAAFESDVKTRAESYAAK